MDALRQIDAWPCEHAVAIVAGRVDVAYGATDRVFPWASVSKLATAVAMLVAAEEGIIDLDEAAGPPGATFRHLLAHASGLPFDEGAPIAQPGRRRIYSNYGFEVAAARVEERAEMPFAAYFDHVWAGAGLHFAGSAGSGVSSGGDGLRALAHELLSPARVAPETLAEASSVQFPGLDGVLPGFGRQTPNDWGLGLELRDGKSPHWTGAHNSPGTFGHFGRSGTFLWVDPAARVALGVLTDHPFGGWAVDAWPRLADAVLAEAG